MNPSTSTLEDLVINSPIVDMTSLDMINSKLSQLAIKDAINTPIRFVLPHVMLWNNQVLAENEILKRRLAEIEKIVCARQERKNGKRTVLKGKNVISTLEILEELKKCEETAKLRKKKEPLKREKVERMLFRSMK